MFFPKLRLGIYSEKKKLKLCRIAKKKNLTQPTKKKNNNEKPTQQPPPLKPHTFTASF